jgi:hypothetical protein
MDARSALHGSMNVNGRGAEGPDVRREKAV